MTKLKTMADVWKDIEKQHGTEGMYVANSSMTTYTDVTSTGSYALDDALGIWGIPGGRIIQFAGQESSGKTYMSLILIAKYQKQNPDGWAMFVDAEFTFDSDWAKALGVDLDRLMVYRENSGTKIFERLVGQPNKTGGKKVKLGILDLEKENPSGLGFIVIDSVAAMTPPQEETSEVGKNNMALMARFLPPELRKITPMLAATGVSLIGINQIRLSPGVMYGNPEMSPGGNAWKHACSMMLNFSRIAAKDSQILNEKEERIGHHVRVRIDKNKLAPPYRVAEIALTYTGGIVDKNIEIRDLAAKYGIIERPNNKTWMFNGEKYNGQDAMSAALVDEKIQEDLLVKVKEAKASGVVAKNIDDETAEE